MRKNYLTSYLLFLMICMLQSDLNIDIKSENASYDTAAFLEYVENNGAVPSYFYGISEINDVEKENLNIENTTSEKRKKNTLKYSEKVFAPTVTTQNITVQLDAFGNASIADDAVNNGSIGNGVLSYTTDITSFTCANLGANAVVLTVTDDDGSSIGNATVTVEDSLAPTLTGAPYTGTIGTNDCMANAATAAPFNGANAIMGYSDNCSGSVSASLTGTNVTGTDASWSVEYTFTVSDTNGNDFPGQTYSNTGGDNSAPSLTGSAYTGTTGTNDCMANAATAAPFNGANAILGYTDACGGSVSATLTGTNITGTDASWSVEYTFTVFDVHGNGLIDQTYSNTGGESTPPSLTGVAYSGTNGTNDCMANAATAAPFNATNAIMGYTDNCGGLVTAILTNTNVTGTDKVWSVAYTFTISDASGNTLPNQTYSNTGGDTENPVISCPSPAASYNADSGVCYYELKNNSLNPGISDYSDNCTIASVTNNINGTNSIKDEQFPVGTTTVIWTVTDNSGNTATCSYDIVVVDTQNPTITCPADITVNNDLGQCDAAVTIVNPTAVDNCSSVFTYTGIRSDGLLLTDAYPIGITTITWTATDEHGNISLSCDQTVTVEDLNKDMSLTIFPNPDSNVCSGTSVEFIAVPLDMDDPASVTYQWKLNGSNVAGATSSTYTNTTLSNGDAIDLEVSYCTGSVTSNVINMTVNPLLTPTVVIVSDDPDNSVCDGTPVTFEVFSNENDGLSPVYQWKLNGANVGTNSTTYTNASLNDGDLITVVMTSSETCLAVSTATSNQIDMTVVPLNTPNVVVTPDFTTICDGSQVTFTAAPTNGGLSPSYQWKLNGVNVGSNSNTYLNSSLSSSDVVTVVMSPSNDICVSTPTATSSNVSVTVNPNLTPTVSIISDDADNTICDDGTLVTFSVDTMTNEGASPTYQWQVDGSTVGTGTSFASSTLNDGDLVTLILTSNETCLATATANSNSISMTVMPVLTSSVSISSNDADNSICNGDSVSFTASPVNGGGTPGYQWKINGINVGGAVNSIFTTTGLADGDEVTVAMMSSADVCVNSATVTSNAITTVVYSAAPVISGVIQYDTNAICFDALGNSFWIDPNTVSDEASFTWTVPSGFDITSGQGTESIIINPTGSAVDGNVTVTATNPCGSSATIIEPITVGTYAYASAGPDQIVCVGTTQVSLDGDIDGVIKNHKQWDWEDDGAGGTVVQPNNLSSTYQLPNSILTGGTVTVWIRTSEPKGSCGAAIEDSMTITVLPIPVVNAGSDDTVCQSSSPLAITLAGASVTRSSATYETGAWSITSGTGTLSDTGQTANPELVTFTPDANYTGTVELTLTSDAPGTCSAVTAIRLIQIDPLPIVSAGTDQIICSIDIVNLNGSVSGGGTSGTWTSSSGATTFSNINDPNASYSPTVTDISNGVVTLTYTSDDPSGPCSAISDTVIITINQAPTVSAGNDQTICSTGAVTLSGVLGGSAAFGTWTSSSGGTNFNDVNAPNAIYTPSATDISNGSVTLTFTTNDPSGPCNASSDDVLITIEAAPVVVVGNDATICSNATFLAEVTSLSVGATGSWSTSGSGTFANPTATSTSYTPSAFDINAGTVVLTFTTDVNGTCAAVSDALNLSIKREVLITDQPDNTGVCITNPASIGIVAEGDDLTYQWYKVSNGNAVNNNANISGATTNTLSFAQARLTDIDSYYVVVSSSNGVCGSVTSDTVSLQVNEVIDIVTDLNDQTVCEGSTATLSVQALGTIVSYEWYKDGVLLTGGEPYTNSLVLNNVTEVDQGSYYVDIISSGSFCANVYSQTAVLNITQPINITTQPLSQSFCNSQDVTLSVAATGSITSYQWRKDGVDIAGANSDSYIISNGAAADSGTYDVVLTAESGGCTDETSDPAIISIIPATVGGAITGWALDAHGDPTPISNVVTACHLGEGELTLSGQTGTILRWESTTDGGLNWTSIGNNGNTTYIFNNITVATGFRAVLQSGTCGLAYSSMALVNVIPPDIKPSPVSATPTTLCLGESSIFYAESGVATNLEAGDGGDFNTGQFPDKHNPDMWLIDGKTGSWWTASGDNTKVNNWSGTNNHPVGTNYEIEYDSEDFKFGIAHGDFNSAEYFTKFGHNNPTTLETPIISLLGMTEAEFGVNYAYNLELGDYSKIELSLDGGATYSIVMLDLQGSNPTNTWNWAAASNSPSTSTNYLFGNSRFTYDLSSYLGHTNLRIKFTFWGTTDESAMAIDNIEIPVSEGDNSIEWTDEDINIIISTENTASVTPQFPGVHLYGVTSLINGCRSQGIDGTEFVTLYVNYAYAGENIVYTQGQCGSDFTQLNAYDNTKTPEENFNKGAYNAYDASHPKGNQPGTGVIGTWSIISGPNTCSGGSFSDVNDPDATFTGDAGTYVLEWSVGGCTSQVSVTITICDTVDFDGENDHINFSDNYSLTGDFSIEVWVKPETDPTPASSIQTIFSKRDASTMNNGYDLRTVNNTVSFNWGNGNSMSSPYQIGTDRWYHIAVTNDSGNYLLFIDGIQVASASSSAPTSNNFDCILGAMDQSGNPLGPPENYFSGWIDELRIWDVALTEEQLHQMMNQQIQQNGSSVRGEIVPIDVNGPEPIASNTLYWSDLAGYYRMDQISCGNLNPNFNVGADGRLMNITTAEEQTAPLPYTTRVDSQQWATDNSWTHFSVWDPPNSNGVDGAPIDWNIARVSHHINSGNKDISLLGLLLDTPNKLMTVAEPGEALDENNDGQGLLISHYLLMNGNIDLVGESQLVQKRYTANQYSESILDNSSSGYLQRDQQGTRSSFNYNYWSSPVSYQGAANNAPYSVASLLKDGTDAQNPGSISYGGHWSFADGARTSPIKLSNYWLWKFNGDDNIYEEWIYIGSTGNVLAGEGYTMKGTDGSASIADRQNYVFEGKPNNGSINLSLAVGDDRLLGNPYPSAMDANQFILDNIIDNGGNASSNIINGSLYYWDHFAGATHILSQYIGGYATYSLIGGVEAISTDYRINVTNDESAFLPERYIPVAQGFFVVFYGGGGNVTFRNWQRSFVREQVTGNNTGSYFFKSSTKNKSTGPEAVNENEDTRKRIRLKFYSPLGYHRQILVGIDERASNAVDIGFDAPLIEENEEDMFWIIDGEKFVIQGVENFNRDQEFPIGVKIGEEGQASIQIDTLENLEPDIKMYVKDKLLNETYEISKMSYEFNLEPGEYIDRFSLVFQPLLKSVEEIGLTEGIQAYVDNDYSLLKVNKLVDTEILNIRLFNYLGQEVQVWKNNLSERNLSLSVHHATGAYIVQVNTTHGPRRKKVIIE